LECRHTGYRGRAGLYELMVFNEQARALLQSEGTLMQLRRAAAQEGLRSLRLGGVRKVAEGVTTLEEVLRSTPVWEA
jgi:general secretion pathway protein E